MTEGHGPEPNRLSYDFADPEQERCEWARTLQTWFDEQRARLGPAPDLVALNQLLLLLQHKYFALARGAPKAHRTHLSPRGHVCLYQTYASIYDTLESLVHRIDPPHIQSLRRVETVSEPAPKTAFELLDEMLGG